MLCRVDRPLLHIHEQAGGKIPSTVTLPPPKSGTIQHASSLGNTPTNYCSLSSLSCLLSTSLSLFSLSLPPSLSCSLSSQCESQIALFNYGLH